MASPSGVAPGRYKDTPRPEPPPYEYKDAVGGALWTTAVMGGVGLFVSSVQNTLTKQNTTAWGVLTKFGGTTVTFGTCSYSGIADIMFTIITAAMGGAFEFSRIAAANLREKDDSWNPAIGGFFGGAVAGMKCSCICRATMRRC